MLGAHKEPMLLRLLLPDSGHYLLIPSDNNGAQDVPCDTADKVAFLTKNIVRRARSLGLMRPPG